jgi:protein-tyrosine phosphatase
MQAEMYEITPCPQGRLAICPRPRGALWLMEEMASLKKRGVTDVVSLLTPAEATELQLQAEEKFCNDLVLKFHRYPIPDRGLPVQPVFDQFITMLLLSLVQGGFIAIHCRAGIGRSAVVAAALLCRFGLSADQAIDLISNARGFDVPDTDEQLDFIRRLGK